MILIFSSKVVTKCDSREHEGTIIELSSPHHAIRILEKQKIEN